MKIVEFHNIDRADWDAFASASPDAWLMHQSRWVEIEATFFVDSNLSFALVSDDRIVALQPLYISSARSGTAYGEVLIHSGIHRHAGLAVASGVSKKFRREAQRQTIAHILEVAAGLGADRIQLNSQNLAPTNGSARREEIPYFVLDYGFHQGMAFGPAGMSPYPGMATCNADQIIDLTIEKEELFDGVDTAARRAVRKAEKNNLEFDVDDDAERLSQYMHLAVKSSKRTKEELPSPDYYRSVFDRFSSRGEVFIAFASHEAVPIAALLILVHKGAGSFLAGVSDPDYLQLRPNDFIHWHMMLWLKSQGVTQYRLGPWFPEAPREWPISKVSAFKRKFGARAVPIIQGSMFLKAETYRQATENSIASALQIGAPPRDSVRLNSTLGAEVIAHHLRLFGYAGASTDAGTGNPLICEITDTRDWAAARQLAEKGRAVVLLRPQKALRWLGILGQDREICSGEQFTFRNAEHNIWGTVRSLHASHVFKSSDLTPLLENEARESVWAYRRLGSGHIFLIGTDLAADLIRLRQGDPAAALRRPTEAQWGFAGERPTYLFEDQLRGRDPADRPADWWIWGLRTALAQHAGLVPGPVLPSGAAGLIVVTGDDDQAALADYRRQRAVLKGLPTTYFLHPLTKHDAKSMAEVGAGQTVEWELHPDALESPGEYSSRLAEQVQWLSSLTGRSPRLVRNHGYLNDGYWGHARAWIEQGITGSSNLPGVDGRVLNGSLLPARLALDGTLSAHWSILTAFGDGVAFIHNWSDRAMFENVVASGRRIAESGVPGVLVLNLHPENVVRATPMHQAVLHLVKRHGFKAMTLGATLDWFSARDANRQTGENKLQGQSANRLGRVVRRLASAFGHGGMSSRSRP